MHHHQRVHTQPLLLRPHILHYTSLSLPQPPGDYWGWFGSRSYHHTGPVSTFYAMREALQIVADEGLDKMWARHVAAHQQLWEGLHSLGLQSYVENDADRWVATSNEEVMHREGLQGVLRTYVLCSWAPANMCSCFTVLLLHLLYAGATVP